METRLKRPNGKTLVIYKNDGNYKNSLSYSGATLCNSLPRDIRQAESLGLFKRLIKEVR